MMREIPRSENEKVPGYNVQRTGTQLAQPAKPVKIVNTGVHMLMFKCKNKPKNQTSVVLTMVFLTAYRSPTS